MNEVTKVLMDKPYEHRVFFGFAPRIPYYDLAGDPNFFLVIHWWMENDFPGHDIQTLAIDQMPRAPLLDGAYLNAFPYRSTGQAMPDFNYNLAAAARLWKLTNTRYLLAATNFLPALDAIGGPEHRSFRVMERFNLAAKPGVSNVVDAGDMTPLITDQGNFALNTPTPCPAPSSTPLG
jgi:hypothetical protein